MVKPRGFGWSAGPPEQPGSAAAVLSLAVCAMLCGLYAIAQWGRDHGAAAGEALGFRHA